MRLLFCWTDKGNISPDVKWHGPVAEMGFHLKNLTPEAKLSARMLYVTQSRYQGTPFTFWLEGGMQ